VRENRKITGEFAANCPQLGSDRLTLCGGAAATRRNGAELLNDNNEKDALDRACVVFLRCPPAAV
jgi:hypothetical protein